MKTLILSPNAQVNLKKYITNYRGYFFELYTDTGIWSEDLIVDNYIQESIKREKEIEELLKRRLSPDVVLGQTLMNSLLLPWRSKTIFVSWEDVKENTRRIIDLTIR